jgi:predicted DNA-binding transcriptional regulator AlpA
MQPRLIRLRDAPKYLGMDRNRFNSEVRPHLVTLKIGSQGVAFDRIDLDQWADQFKQNEGKPAKKYIQWPEKITDPC